MSNGIPQKLAGSVQFIVSLRQYSRDQKRWELLLAWEAHKLSTIEELAAGAPTKRCPPKSKCVVQQLSTSGFGSSPFFEAWMVSVQWDLLRCDDVVHMWRGCLRMK